MLNSPSVFAQLSSWSAKNPLVSPNREMRCGSRYVLVTVVYFLCGSLLLLVLFSAKEEFRLNIEKLEDIPMNCGSIMKESNQTRRDKSWPIIYKTMEEMLIQKDEICSLLDEYFTFEKSPLSVEEKRFPLAFGFLVHTNFLQILLELSIFYQPQNYYCIIIDNLAPMDLKNVLMKIPRCFDNVYVQMGDYSSLKYHKMGVLNNAYNCITDLTIPSKKWEYFQFLTGQDLPLKTNLEMVKILQELNGTINTEIEEYASWRYGIRRSENPPLPLYQGGMAVALPRSAADFLVESKKINELLIYLEKTHMPYDSFWATIAANKKLFPIPGSVDGEEILELKRKFKDFGEMNKTMSYLGTTSIARFEVLFIEENCRICLFENRHVEKLRQRPELIAHKFSLEDNPSLFMCFLKEVRDRSKRESSFDAALYSEMPTVELGQGRATTELSHPNWIIGERRTDVFS